MRLLIAAILVVALTALTGYAACAALDRDPHLRSMAFAAGAALLACLLAGAPLVIVRSGSPVGVAQAALLGTVIHLFVIIAAAGTLILTGAADAAFTYWLMAFYLVTLPVVAGGAIVALRRAAAGAGSASTSATTTTATTAQPVR